MVKTTKSQTTPGPPSIVYTCWLSIDKISHRASFTLRESLLLSVRWAKQPQKSGEWKICCCKILFRCRHLLFPLGELFAASKTAVFPRWFQIMGIAKRCGRCLKAIYLNWSELNIKFLIKHSRSVAGKLIEMKKPPENLFISPRGT